MALGKEGPQLESVDTAPAGRMPFLLLGLAAAFTVVALLKPWAPASPALGAPTGMPVRPVATGAATASAVPTMGTAAAVFFRPCFPTTNWRLTAIQHDGGLEVRTVWPTAARFDVNQPPTGAPHLVGGGVEGIGFCAPGDEQSVRVARSAAVSVWRRDEDGQIVPVEGASMIDALLAQQGEVYLAPPAVLAVDGGWPAGDYFFEVSPAHPGSSATWLALQLLAAALPTPSVGPTSPAARMDASSAVRR